MRRLVVPLIAFATMWFFATIAVKIKSLNPLTETVSSFSFSDIYYNILHQTAKPDTSRNISIVDIYLYQGRGNFARLLREIESCHPKAICVDAVFEGERPDDMEGDMALMAVAEEYDNIIYSMKMEDVVEGEDGLWESGSTIHSFFAKYIPVREAFCNMPRGNLYDEMKRMIPIAARVGDSACRSMVIETANMFAGHDIARGRTDQIAINYSPMVFPSISPDDVLQHADLIENRVVYIGDMHDGTDQHWTPTGKKISGVEVFAYATETVLAKKEIANLPGGWHLVLSYLFIFVLQIILDCHSTYTLASKSVFVKYLVGSTYVKNIITFAYSAIILGISFMVFAKCNLSISWGWALSSAAFLSTARNLYSAVQNCLNNSINLEKMRMNKLKRIIPLWLLLSACQQVFAQDYTVTYVAGAVKGSDNGKSIAIKLNSKISVSTIVDVPEDGQLQLIDEKQSKRYTISTAGIGTVPSLMQKKGNSIMQLSECYLAYIKDQIGGKGNSEKLMKAHVYTDYATVTRDMLVKAQEEEEKATEIAISKLSPIQRVRAKQELNMRRHKAFRDSINNVHLKFMRKVWSRMKAEPAFEKPVFEEVKPQIADPNQSPTDRLKLFDWLKRIVKSDGKNVVKAEKLKPKSVTKPYIPVEEVKAIPTLQTNGSFPFDFFGTKMNVRLDESCRINLGRVSPDRVADALKRFGSGKYDNFLYDCQSLRQQHKLNDWAYFKMVETICNEFFTEKSNEAVLLAGYIYYQSGYAVRFASSPDQQHLYLLISSEHKIYGIPYYKFSDSDLKFYLLDESAPDQLDVSSASFPKEQGLSLYIQDTPILTDGNKSEKVILGYKNETVSVKVSVNPNLIHFFNTYPASEVNDDVMTRWVMYANTPLDANVKEQLYPQLHRLIDNQPSSVAKVNVLMNLLHGMPYEYDEKIWGRDRAFFAEETLYYPYCDCEDRSILLTRLVRDLVGLKCALVYYPGHLATAICFEHEQPGAAFIVDGDTYTVCDPTYLGTGAGEQMPDMDQNAARLILLE